jgi:hypothetical protein
MQCYIDMPLHFPIPLNGYYLPIVDLADIHSAAADGRHFELPNVYYEIPGCRQLGLFSGSLCIPVFRAYSAYLLVYVVKVFVQFRCSQAL